MMLGGDVVESSQRDLPGRQDIHHTVCASSHVPDDCAVMGGRLADPMVPCKTGQGDGSMG